MGDLFFDFEELDASLCKSVAQDVLHIRKIPLISTRDETAFAEANIYGRVQAELTQDGEVFHVPVNSLGLGRGTLVLDVRLKTVAEEWQREGLVLCVSKTGKPPCIDAKDFHWTSGLLRCGCEGWRCKIQVHKWRYIAPDAILLVASRRQPPVEPLQMSTAFGTCVDFESWAGSAPVVANVSIFEVEMSFHSEVSCISSRELVAAYNCFHNVFNAIDGNHVAEVGKVALNREKDMELTYGEIEFLPFRNAFLRAVAPRDGEIFVDLGSGTGRALIAIALASPWLKQCIGYELVPSLHLSAQRVIEGVKSAGIKSAPIELLESDFLKNCSWDQDADIVWVASLCMSRETMNAIQHQACNLKSGARIITMNEDFGSSMSEFECLYFGGERHIRVEMSFGDASIYVVRRTEGVSRVSEERRDVIRYAHSLIGMPN